MKLYLFYFILAQLAMLRHKLKVTREAATIGSDKELVRVKRPDKAKNIQNQMSLTDDDETYHNLCVSFFF
jgi:hypothetical protein